ncbi:MAG: hypothetical protein WA082_04570 [Candidatus Moraniibacteriota bacterium]
MITPRPYLSWSSMNLFESNLEGWKRVYLYGEQMRVNRGMAFGRIMAEGLEHDEMTGDPVLDMIMAQLPKFEIMDQPVNAILKNGKEEIPLLAKPDTMKADMTAFKEYKTGQAPWSRKQVDESGQITFYATVLFILTQRIPHDIELVHVQTAKVVGKEAVDARIGATGAIHRHPTSRNMSQILNMMIRMKRAWEGIQRVTAEEML